MTYADTLRPLDEVTLEAPTAAPSVFARAGRGGLAWCRRHRRSLLVVAGLLAVATTVHAWGMYRYPSRTVNDDEGTYVAQAWAVLRRGTLTHYTYWYDHPPLGWLQIAGWAWLTDGFRRVPHGVSVGREVMLLAKVASCALMYLLGRRLGYRRPFAAAAVLLFALSPLALQFSRMVFLDNLAVPWVLAALVLALSPRKRLIAAAGSAATFAIAVLTKETTLVLLPAVGWFLWRGSDPRTRRFSLMLFGTVFTALVAFYPLYALVKGELFEGRGHVSLLWAMRWQVFLRSGNGSVFDAGSVARARVTGWLTIDPWLLGAGGCFLPFGFASRRLRPLALLLGVQVLTMIRGGYLPHPFVIGLLPFAALLAAGVGDDLWSRAERCSRRASRLPLRVPVLASLVVAVVLVAPGWARDISLAATTDADGAMRSAVAWMGTHVPRSSRMIVDDSSWAELVGRGFVPSRTIWFYKIDVDPAVQRTLGGQGWRAVDYLLDPDDLLRSPSVQENHPTVVAAREHSRVIARFFSPGRTPADHTVGIRQVVK